MGAQIFAELIGRPPAEAESVDTDRAATDTFMPHPQYGSLGWVSVICPGPQTLARSLLLLREAHEADRRRVERRQ